MVILDSTVFRMQGRRSEGQAGRRRMPAKMISRQIGQHYQAVAPNPEAWPILVEKNADPTRSGEGAPLLKLGKVRVRTPVLMSE